VLAKRVPPIMPQLTAARSIETTRIYKAPWPPENRTALLATRPHRSAASHLSNSASFSGGGNRPTPG